MQREKVELVLFLLTHEEPGILFDNPLKASSKFNNFTRLEKYGFDVFNSSIKLSSIVEFLPSSLQTDPVDAVKDYLKSGIEEFVKVKREIQKSESG